MKPLGPIAYILKARVTLVRDVGAAMSPFNAFMFIQGLETLPLRIREHCSNANAVAAYLSNHPKVTRVIFPGLMEGKAKLRADSYLRGGYGGLLVFELKGGRDIGRKFIDALKMFYHVANIGDARSLAIHPASTTHSQLTPEAAKDRRNRGICSPVDWYRTSRRYHLRPRSSTHGRLRGFFEALASRAAPRRRFDVLRIGSQTESRSPTAARQHILRLPP